MSEIQEIVAQFQSEIQANLDEHIVGAMTMNEKTLALVIDVATSTMQRRMPAGYVATPINPRMEGTKIVWDGWLVEHKPNPYSLTPQDVFETNVMAQPMRRREDGKLAEPLTIEEITEAMRRAGADESGSVILNSEFIEAISEVLAERA